MESAQAGYNTRIIATLTLLSWLGMVVHNIAELPGLAWYRPEYVFPSLLSLLLFIGWWKASRKRVWRWLLLSWTGVHLLIGAVLSVLPLAILPFTPEQSAGHYLSHVIYGLAQIPLLLALWNDGVK